MKKLILVTLLIASIIAMSCTPQYRCATYAGSVNKSNRK